ncbi:hypothetical protein QBC37DRAFT_394 [Rhypophila decipiens]|uniref:Uncharacterized protein n=1 Tax=Rhypophila decipiens TaxID=261697 RepID=A0AAN6YNQ9_9PEZI|nr:hypothetical protein QBC37DRAFT_394 [Rhypophila decipiens]
MINPRLRLRGVHAHTHLPNISGLVGSGLHFKTPLGLWFFETASPSTHPPPGATSSSASHLLLFSFLLLIPLSRLFLLLFCCQSLLFSVFLIPKVYPPRAAKKEHVWSVWCFGNPLPRGLLFVWWWIAGIGRNEIEKTKNYTHKKRDTMGDKSVFLFNSLLSYDGCWLAYLVIFSSMG